MKIAKIMLVPAALSLGLFGCEKNSPDTAAPTDAAPATDVTEDVTDEATDEEATEEEATEEATEESTEEAPAEEAAAE